MIIDKNIKNSKALNRFKTLEQDFHNIHNNKYSYDLFIHAGSHKKSIIICPEHGKFEQNPTNHLQGKGCPTCAIELRAENRIKEIREDFITKAKNIHGNKYDYSKTFYNGSSKKCIFICKVHEEFQQLPLAHLKGKGCSKCGDLSMANKQSAEHRRNFEIKASKIHNNFYDYSNYIYINNKTKGKIICPIHGEFQQVPTKHINGKQGCPKCGSEAMAEKQSVEAKKEFKDKAFKTHDGIYDYSKFFYKNSSTKSIIICSKCLQEFRQTAEDHLRGRGCPNCKSKRDNNAIYIWQALKEFYDGKPLYKIGVTSARLKKNRILQVANKLGWEYKIILIKNVICEARELERKLHTIGTNPNLAGFDGATEFRAFDEHELQKAIDVITPYIKNEKIMGQLI